MVLPRRAMATVTRFSATHEYITLDTDTGVGKVGISDFAQSKLGDVVFVELPEAGASFKAGDSFGSVESVKAASDVYMPVAGKVVKKNDAIIDKPQLVNEAAMGDGWFVTVQVANAKDISSLMDAKVPPFSMLAGTDTPCSNPQKRLTRSTAPSSEARVVMLNHT